MSFKVGKRQASPMRNYVVRLMHRRTHEIREYLIVAEKIAIAEKIVKSEGLEWDEQLSLRDGGITPNDWLFHSSGLLETCTGCGGLREKIRPPGTGSVNL